MRFLTKERKKAKERNMAISCATFLGLKSHFLVGILLNVVFQTYMQMSLASTFVIWWPVFYITLVSVSPPTSHPIPVLS